MKIYTKTGDKGQTGLFGGKRLSKSDSRINAYGTVDELNAHIGLVADIQKDKELQLFLRKIQDRLFVIGSMLAADPDKNMKVPHIKEHDISQIEEAIDKLESELSPLQHFILPGGHEHISFCHIARCVCRRGERDVVHLAEKEAVDNYIIIYLNRLSDFLFILCRKMAKDIGVEEIKWMPEK